MNASFIALIPKKENAMTQDGFRPIALCNVVYKITSKVVANRIKPLLPSRKSKQAMWKDDKFSTTSSKHMRWYTLSKANSKQA